MEFFDLLKDTVDAKASDLHITVGIPPVMRIHGKLQRYGETSMTPKGTDAFIRQILSEAQLEELEKNGELDLPFFLPGVSRFRINVYKQRGWHALAIRVIPARVPALDELGLPGTLKDLCRKSRGLILVTGPSGSGKSTTLAAMVDHINRSRSCHIITLEDPIEYLHEHNQCIVNQREIGSDSRSFSNALRAALREDPDVILVGEMRDPETMGIVLTAAETGHLVLSTLHTIRADQTVDRIIDSFPVNQQAQIRIQLAQVLEGIIAQQLLPLVNGKGRVAALEILLATDAVRNLIREGKTHQILTAVQTGTKVGMQTMDASLNRLVREGFITFETAREHALDPEMPERRLPG